MVEIASSQSRSAAKDNLGIRNENIQFTEYKLCHLVLCLVKFIFCHI